jgi:hypothetical protein
MISTQRQGNRLFPDSADVQIHSQSTGDQSQTVGDPGSEANPKMVFN